MRLTHITLFIVTCSLFISVPCMAHKVRIFAWGEGNTIHTESKFSGGRPAQHAAITVLDSSTGDELLQGTTNEQGLFEFPTPDLSVEEINIIVNSGDGHKNNWLYQLEEVPEDNPELTHNHDLPATTNSATAPETNLTQEQVRQIVNDSLETKLAPIRRLLAEESDQKPDLKDILGGIGYILGLAGIAAYMKSKKQ